MATAGDALVEPAKAAKTSRKSDGAEPSDSVRRAILHASHDGSVNPRLMFNIAKRESTFKPDRWAILSDGSRGDAYGLYQIKPQTWFETIQRHGADYGLGKIARAIHRVKGQDTYTTGDKSVDDRVLAFRSHPYLSALMAIARMKAESGDVAAARGHDTPTEADMYSVHFLGKRGAMNLARASNSHPGLPASQFYKKAARDNSNMFHDRNGRPYGVREFWNNLQEEMAS